MQYENEIWIPVKGLEKCYEVSNYCRIKSVNRTHLKFRLGKYHEFKIHEKILKQSKDKITGYLYVNLRDGEKQHVKTVHRIIAEAFIPNPENKRTVNHKNGVRDDNRLENLEWNTHSENIKHSFDVLKRDRQFGRKAYWKGIKGPDHPLFGVKKPNGYTGYLNHKSKEVKCDTLDMLFGSTAEAAKALGISQPCISLVCQGKALYTSGLSFRYTRNGTN